jgi:hypothetical protein
MIRPKPRRKKTVPSKVDFTPLSIVAPPNAALA